MTQLLIQRIRWECDLFRKCTKCIQFHKNHIRASDSEVCHIIENTFMFVHSFLWNIFCDKLTNIESSGKLVSMNCQAIMFESSTCANCVLSEVLILHSVVNRVCIQIVSFEGGGNNICLQKLCVIPENKPPFSPHGRQACPQSSHRPSGSATRTPPSTSSACRPPIKPN